MSTLTIRGCDDALTRALRNASKERGLSVNKLVIDTLETTFKKTEGKRRHDDLAFLAGTWTDEEVQEFEAEVRLFEQINPEDWQ